MITIILLLICLLCIVFYLFKKKLIVNYNKKQSIYDNQLNPFSNKWNKNDLLLAINTLTQLIDLFEQNNIQYFISFGTLLGYQRNRQIIEWDDDLDLVVISHPSKVRELLSKSKNLKLITHDLGFDKVFMKNSNIIPGYQWGWPFIDLFYAKIDKDNLLVYYQYDNKPDYKFPLKCIFPLKTVKFYQMNVKVPYKIKKILKILYGKKYLKYCQSSDFDHQNENKINRTYTVKCNNLNQIDIYRNQFPVFVINLEHRTDRRLNVVNQLKPLNLNPNFIKAVDSKEISEFYQTLPNNKVSIGEVACGLSHIKIWKKIIKDKIPLSLIFEDDIIIPDNVTYQDIINRYNDSKGGNMVLLGYCGGQSPLIKTSERQLTTFPGKAVCLHAYFLTLTGAKKLIKMTKQWDYTIPIDWVTEQMCDKELCFLSTSIDNTKINYFGNGIIFQDRNLGSNLDNKKPFISYLKGLPNARLK